MSPGAADASSHAALEIPAAPRHPVGFQLQAATPRSPSAPGSAPRWLRGWFWVVDVPWRRRTGAPVDRTVPWPSLLFQRPSPCPHPPVWDPSLGSTARSNEDPLCDRHRGELGRGPWGRDGGGEVTGRAQGAFPPLPSSGVGKSCHKTLRGWGVGVAPCQQIPRGCSACAGTHPGQRGTVVPRGDKMLNSSSLEHVDHVPWGAFSRTEGRSSPCAPNNPPRCQLLSSEVQKAPLERFPSPCSLFLQRDALLLYFAGFPALPVPCRQHRYPLLRLPRCLPGSGCWKAH